MPLTKPREGQVLPFHVYPRESKESTLGDPEAIIWSSIHHLCSRYVASGIAAVHGITRKRDREDVAWNLKLYIQHASEFYEAARAAKPNTAPLIYYYAFLNLAKAFCELRRPRFHRQAESYRHGLSWRPDPRRLVDPARDTVSITARGVWHILWESITLQRCPAANPTLIRIKDLFSYCPEVSVEFRGATNDLIRLIDIEKPELLFDQSSSESWLRFSVKRYELRGFRLSAAALRTQIRTARSDYREVKSDDRQLRTFESSVPKRLGRREYVAHALWKDVLGLNVFAHFGHNRELQYSFPLQKHLPLRMPQLMVSYTILFWLGSLVRYDPHSVNALMDSEWWRLIDGFMSQSRLWLLELFEWAFYQAETSLWTAR